jgi:hypothetical protein
MDAYTPTAMGQEEKIQVYFGGNQDPSKLTESVNKLIDSIIGRNGTIEEIRHGTETVGYGLQFTVVVFYRVPR